MEQNAPSTCMDMPTSLKRDTHPPPTLADDESLAVAAARDMDAFAELYRRYAERIYRYLLARTGGVDDAQELTAATFFSALEAIGRYRRGHFRAWLFGIARHHASHHFRRAQQLVALDECLNANISVEELAIEHLRAADVMRALHTLAPERAEALALRLLAGLTPAEVAQIMGKREGTVRVLVHRAIREMRERLESEV